MREGGGGGGRKRKGAEEGMYGFPSEAMNKSKACAVLLYIEHSLCAMLCRNYEQIARVHQSVVSGYLTRSSAP